MAELNRRQATWLSRQGNDMDAITFALEAGDDALAYDLIFAAAVQAGFGQGSGVETLEELIHKLPPSHNLDQLRLVAHILDNPDFIPVGAARSIRASLPNDLRDSDLVRYAAAVLSLSRYVSWQEDTDVVDEALAIARRVIDQDDMDISQSERALLLAEFGVYELYHGRCDVAIGPLQKAVTAAQIASVPWLRSWVLSALSLAHALDGSTSTARRVGEEATLVGGATADITLFTTLTCFSLAICALNVGDIALAEAQLKRLEEFDRISPGSERTDGVWRILVRGTASMAKGEFRHACQLAEHFVGSSMTCTPWQRFLVNKMHFDSSLAAGEMTHASEALDACQREDLPEEITGVTIMRANLALRQGKANEAFELLQELDDERPSFHRKATSLNLLMAFGVAASVCNRPAESIDAFQRAGVLAERLGVNTPNAAHVRAGRFVAAEDPGLTSSELGVLKEITSDDPLSEIAQRLFISPNTLKTHLKRIYKKLNVGGRSEAVRKAKSLGISLD